MPKLPTSPLSLLTAFFYLTLAAVLFSAIGFAQAPPKRPTIGPAGEYSGLIAYLQKIIPQELKRSKAQCASIALIEDQRVIWSAGFGNAANGRTPLPAATA